MANGIDLKLELPSDDDLKRMWDMVPKLERYQVLDKATREVGKVVVDRAQQLAPRSSKTGTNNKRGKNQAKEANWNYPLWKSIRMVVRKYSRVTIVVIGPKHPEGNKAYFNTSPDGRRQVLWGLRTGKRIPQIRNWIVQAFDETKAQQMSAMKASLQTSIDQVMRG